MPKATYCLRMMSLKYKCSSANAFYQMVVILVVLTGRKLSFSLNISQLLAKAIQSEEPIFCFHASLRIFI